MAQVKDEEKKEFEMSDYNEPHRIRPSKVDVPTPEEAKHFFGLIEESKYADLANELADLEKANRYKKGFLLNLCKMRGQSPLIIAIYKNDLKMVKLLCMEGANLNDRENSSNLTPLIIAISRGYFDIANHLLNKGANSTLDVLVYDASANDFITKEPFDFAIEQNDPDFLANLLTKIPSVHKRAKQDKYAAGMEMFGEKMKSLEAKKASVKS